MAKIVRYFQDNDDEMYSEGPFVLCAGPFEQGYRIEIKGTICPGMAPMYVHEYRKRLGIPPGWQPFEVLAPVVDQLNAEYGPPTVGTRGTFSHRTRIDR